MNYIAGDRIHRLSLRSRFVFLYQVVRQQELEEEVISSSVLDRNFLMLYVEVNVDSRLAIALMAQVGGCE